MIDEKKLYDMFALQKVSTGYGDVWQLNQEQVTELIRLARLGLWSEKHGVPALKTIAHSDYRLHWSDMHSVGPSQEAWKAIEALPKGKG